VGAALLSGGCWCGAARYAVEDAFDYAVNCHCGGCRRTTGAAYKPFAGIPSNKVTVMRGADALLIVGDALTHDVHCAACGSLLYSILREGAWAHVAMGTLIDAPSIRPTHHIFVADKAPWHEITDNLPQFAGHEND